MHWGHAISTDLIHWEEKPIALFPRSMEDAAFSGGAVIDSSNTSEFGIAAEEPMVLSYTSTGRGECLAYSLDKGQTFQEYIDNPILVHQGRDPKIIRYDDERKWVMVVYEDGDGKQGYDILESRDLIHWHWLQHLPDWFECPELFELPVMEDSDDGKMWVVYGCVQDRFRSAFQIGYFDGHQFTPSSNKFQGHAGPHFYAAQVFSNAPDNRMIMIGWLAGAQYPDMPFGHGMSLPLALSLRKMDDEVRLCFYPVEEIKTLRTREESYRDISIRQTNELLAGISYELIDMEIEFDLAIPCHISVNIGGYILEYNPDHKELSFAGAKTHAQPGKKSLDLRIIVDRSVTEIFVDRGWGAFSAMTIFEQNPPKIVVGGTAVVCVLRLFELQSIWSMDQSA
jgi:fructan beta-fructosidase